VLDEMTARAEEAAAGLVPGFEAVDANVMLDMIGVYRAAKTELDDKRAMIEAIELELPPDYRPELDLVRRVKGLLFDWRKATGKLRPAPEPDLTGVPLGDQVSVGGGSISGEPGPPMTTWPPQDLETKADPQAPSPGLSAFRP
jgi:hypothetical protein